MNNDRPTIQITRSDRGLNSNELLDGELAWDRQHGKLVIGEVNPATSEIKVKEVQKKITISSVAPTPEDGQEGDIWIVLAGDSDGI